MATSKTRRKPITQDDLFEATYVTDAVFSPDGQQAAYVLAQTSGKGEKEAQSFSIWLVSTSGSGNGKPRRITRGKGNSYHPRFSRDGSELYFVSTRDKVPQIYVMPLAGGEAEQLTELPQGAGPFEVSPDGRSLVFAALKTPPAKPDENRHARIDQFWYRFDPLGGYLQDAQQDVYLMRRGGKPKVVSAVGGIVMAASFTADSRRLAILRTGLRHQKIFEADLSVVDLAGARREKTLVSQQVIATATWDADDQNLICTGPGTDLARQSRLYLVDGRTGQVRDRTGSLDIVIGTSLQVHVPVQIASRVLVRRREVLTTVTRGGEAHVHRVSLRGTKSAKQIGRGERVSHLMAEHDGQLLTISQTFNEPPALFSVDGATGEHTQLTHHNARWHAKFRWPDVERHVVRSARGVEVEGWVLMPKNARAPYKTILNIHGGPHSGYGCSFWADMHELVGAGYAVAYMNPRGSTGYGDAFSRSILGCWGEPELKDFNAFLDHLVDAGIAHPEKLGVTGISGGGHLSGWLIGHTHRFKAAVPEQGVYSMVSMWGTSDAGRDLIELEMDGELHKKPMTYWQLSPIAHAHKCTTPTLLLQGENDIRCPMEQGEQMFAKLKHHGCEVEFIPMKRCSHGEQMMGRPALRRFRMDVMRDWFDRYIS